MRKESVLELKNEVLKSLWERSARQRGTVAETQGLVNPYVESRLAVGYSQPKKGSYKLEFRVQRRHGAAYELAEEFKKKARQEANIEVVPSVEIPSRSSAKNNRSKLRWQHGNYFGDNGTFVVGLTYGNDECRSSS